MADARPEVRWAMNSALAEIGIRYSKLRRRAIPVGEKLGIYRNYHVLKWCSGKSERTQPDRGKSPLEPLQSE